MDIPAVFAPEPSALSAGSVATTQPDEGRRLSRAMTAILLVYLGIILAFMLVRQVKPTPDLFVVFGSIVAVMLGRTRAFLRDWIPLVVIFLGWEAMRGIADDFGADVHSDSIIALERLVSFGIVPTEELQRLLYTPGRPTPLDLAMSLVYLGHFLLPLLIGFFLWMKSGPAYYRYILALVILSFAGFATALFLPVAPPRFAGDYGVETLIVRDVLQETLHTLQFAPVTTWVYGNAIGNPVAAMPSLHAAYPFLGYLILRNRWPRLALGMLAYAGVVWFAIVYLGHHYVVDVVAGVAYAAGAYWLVYSARVRLAAQKAGAVLSWRPQWRSAT